MKRLPGIHFPNQIPFDLIDKFWSIEWGSFVLLHDQRNWIPEIRRHYPNAVIVVRAYTPNWYILKADDWARQVAVWWVDCAPYDCWLTPANEQNLRDEGHPLALSYSDPGTGKAIHPRDVSYKRWRQIRQLKLTYPPAKVYEDIRDWNILFARTIKQLIPGIKLIFPALSWGHSDDQNDAGYIGNEILLPAFEEFDYNVGGHIYYNGRQNRQDKYYGQREQITHAMYPFLKLWINECGSNVTMDLDDGDDYRMFMNECPDYIFEQMSPAFFIYQGANEMSVWSINRKPNILGMFQAGGFDPIPDKPIPSGDSVLQAGLLAAKDLPRIAVNDQAWLYKFGVKIDAGFPECDEKYFDFNGNHYIFQEWSRAYLLMEQGKNNTARAIWKNF